MPTSCLQRDTSCYAAIRSSQHAQVWCCHARRQHNFAIAWACCLHAWQSCAVSVHGTDILSPSMTSLCCVRAWHGVVSMHARVQFCLHACVGTMLWGRMHNYNFVCSRRTCQPPLNSLQLLFHSSCLNPSPVSTLAMRLSASYPPAASNLSIAACRPSSAPLLPAQTALVRVPVNKPRDQGNIGYVSHVPVEIRF